jgi:hypothetical protein
MRRHATALLAAALGVAGLSACSSGSGTTPAAKATTPSRSPSPSPKTPMQVLAASTASAANGTFRFSETLTQGADVGTIGGLVDPAGHRFTFTGDFPAGFGVTLHLELLGVEPELWAKTSFPGASAEMAAQLPELPTSWMHLDPAKLDEATKLAFDFVSPDVSDVSNLMQGLTSATSTGSGGYRGIIDLTKATGQSSVDADVVTALGAAGKAIPFTATVDDHGRIAAFAMAVPAAGGEEAQRIEATFTGYGTAAPLSAPAAGAATEAPEAEYQFLGNDGEA